MPDSLGLASGATSIACAAMFHVPSSAPSHYPANVQRGSKRRGAKRTSADSGFLSHQHLSRTLSPDVRRPGRAFVTIAPTEPSRVEDAFQFGGIKRFRQEIVRTAVQRFHPQVFVCETGCHDEKWRMPRSVICPNISLQDTRPKSLSQTTTGSRFLPRTASAARSVPAL